MAKNKNNELRFLIYMDGLINQLIKCMQIDGLASDAHAVIKEKGGPSPGLIRKWPVQSIGHTGRKRGFRPAPLVAKL